MTSELGSICTYSKNKCLTSSLSNKTYVSTENMLPNRGGITDSSGLPDQAQVSSFARGEILVSNIRPYFKKIWKAQFSGGCSNDVLVFKANPGIDPDYLYYVLSDDRFFEYSTSTSNGTKMPRGDKKAILKYPVMVPSIEKQKKIALILSAIDGKIRLNNRINGCLEAQISNCFDELFGELLNDDLPNSLFGDIARVESGKRPPSRVDAYDKEHQYSLIGAASPMGFTNGSNVNYGALIIGRVGTHGVVQRVLKPSWASDNTLVLHSKYREFVYQVLKRIDYHALNRGSTQPLITQGDIRSLPLRLPTNATLDRFECFAQPLMAMVEHNLTTNYSLESMRDALLPRLMSGEINVDDIEV